MLPHSRSRSFHPPPILHLISVLTITFLTLSLPLTTAQTQSRSPLPNKNCPTNPPSTSPLLTLRDHLDNTVSYPECADAHFNIAAYLLARKGMDHPASVKSIEKSFKKALALGTKPEQVSVAYFDNKRLKETLATLYEAGVDDFHPGDSLSSTLGSLFGSESTIFTDSPLIRYFLLNNEGTQLVQDAVDYSFEVLVANDHFADNQRALQMWEGVIRNLQFLLGQTVSDDDENKEIEIPTATATATTTNPPPPPPISERTSSFQFSQLPILPSFPAASTGITANEILANIQGPKTIPPAQVLALTKEIVTSLFSQPAPPLPNNPAFHIPNCINDMAIMYIKSDSFATGFSVLQQAYKSAIFIKNKEVEKKVLSDFTTVFLAVTTMFDNSLGRINGTSESEDVIKVLGGFFTNEVVGEEAWYELSMYSLASVFHSLERYAESDALYRSIIEKTKAKYYGKDLAHPYYKNMNSGLISRAARTDLRIACVATQWRPELQNLLDSSTNTTSAIEIDVLGMNQTFLGNAQKVQFYKDFVSTLHPEQLVLLVDAYDVVLFESISRLHKLFYSGSITGGEMKKIVISAERSSYPDRGIGRIYTSPSSKKAAFEYLNSGTILGRAEDLYEMLNEVSSYSSLLNDDQRSFTRYYLAHRDTVGLDTDGYAFCTLHGVSESSHIDSVGGGNKGAFRNDALSFYARPAVVHGNAGGLGGKKYYADIVKALQAAYLQGASTTIEPSLYSAAVTAYLGGKEEEAFTLFKKCVAAEPEHPNCLNNAGYMYSLLRGDYLQAEVLYKRCLKVDRTSRDCNLNYSLLLIDKMGPSHTAEAVRMLEVVLSLEEPEDNKGSSNWNLGRVVEDLKGAIKRMENFSGGL